MDFSFFSLILMASFYIFAGISHFRVPRFFLKITPRWVPEPEKVNLIVGAIEVLLGILVLVPITRTYAAWGIIALLVLVFPANVNHFQQSIGKGKWFWITLFRLPLQAVLIYWAYRFVSI